MSWRFSDVEGSTVLRMDKPWFRRTSTVARADGTTLGSISKRLRMGKSRFTIRDSLGTEIGEVRAENWRPRSTLAIDIILKQKDA